MRSRRGGLGGRRDGPGRDRLRRGRRSSASATSARLHGAVGGRARLALRPDVGRGAAIGARRAPDSARRHHRHVLHDDDGQRHDLGARGGPAARSLGHCSRKLPPPRDPPRGSDASPGCSAARTGHPVRVRRVQRAVARALFRRDVRPCVLPPPRDGAPDARRCRGSQRPCRGAGRRRARAGSDGAGRRRGPSGAGRRPRPAGPAVPGRPVPGADEAGTGGAAGGDWLIWVFLLWPMAFLVWLPVAAARAGQQGPVVGLAVVGALYATAMVLAARSELRQKRSKSRARADGERPPSSPATRRPWGDA